MEEALANNSGESDKQSLDSSNSLFKSGVEFSEFTHKGGFGRNSAAEKREENYEFGTTSMRQSYLKLEEIPEVEENIMVSAENSNLGSFVDTTATSVPKSLFENEFKN